LVLLLPVLAVVGTGALEHALLTQLRISMLDQGALISLLVEQELRHARQADGKAALAEINLVGLWGEVEAQAHATVLMLDDAGMVVASTERFMGMDLSTQTEVEVAQQGRQSWSVLSEGALRSLSDDGLVESTLSVANPIVVDGDVEGVILIQRAHRSTRGVVRQMSTRLRFGLVVALLLTLGSAVWLGHWFSRPLRELVGACQRIADGVLSAATDLNRSRSSQVSEVQELARAFGTMTERLQEQLVYVDEFAGNVSHEFKTPLSTLKGTIELLEDNLRDGSMSQSQQARFLENARAEVERMSSLVSGLLALARAESLAESSRVDLDALVEDVLERYPGVECAGRSGFIQGDPSQLAIAMTNLLDNALRHGQPPVQIELEKEGGRVLVRVINAGPPISPSNLNQIFDRFFTTDREYGTGLGLALVRVICRAHGGDVSARSDDKQTVFQLSFPSL